MMTNGARLLLAELERIDDLALAGRSAALKNEAMRAVWPLPRTPKAVSSVPADRLRLRRRLRSA
jgi:hypothetical protein